MDGYDDAPPRKKGFPTGKVLVGVGCGCLVLILGCGGLCGGIFFSVVAALTNSDAYKMALERVRQEPEVMEAFGGSIEPGRMVMGSINVENQSGNATITIPITGPKGSGTIDVSATKQGGVWHVDSLAVTHSGTGQRWDLATE